MNGLGIVVGKWCGITIAKLSSYKITKLNDSSPRRSAEFLHALHQLFSDRAEFRRLPVGTFGRPPGIRAIYYQIWRDSSPYSHRADRPFRGGARRRDPAPVHLHVPAHFILAHCREHAFPLDLRRQRRRLSRPLPLSFVLSVSGLAADFTYILLDANSRVPSIGASGAIAGVMGAYFILYPRARVLVWFPPIFFFHVPAWLMLGYWFLINFVSGTANSIAESTQASGPNCLLGARWRLRSGHADGESIFGTAAPISVWDVVNKPSALSHQPSPENRAAQIRSSRYNIHGASAARSEKSASIYE